MQNILILSFSTIHSDPRVMRQINLLAERYSLTVVGFGPKPDARVEYVDVSAPRADLYTRLLWGIKLLFGFFESYYWSRSQVNSVLAKLDGRVFDLCVANDISALPLVLRLAKGRPVLMDAHEYSPREFDDKLLWRMLFGRYHHYLCRRYLPQVAAMVTVCQGIAEAYAQHYNVSPGVVHNAPLDQRLLPSATQPEKVRLVHHGAAIRSRHLETMIDVMKYLDCRFTLDFMLVENDISYMNDLRLRAKGDERIRFIPAVPMTDICTTINAYDVGIYLLPPVNFNHEHALPNKFFEFIQARLAVAIGPSPEMSRFVEQYSFGVVATSFEPVALATALSSISLEDLQRYKQAADTAAKSINYEAGGRVLLGEINRLLGSGELT